MFLCSCNKSSKKINITEDVTQFTDFAVSIIPKSTKKEPLNLRLKRDRTKLGYTINTFSNKYLSVLSNDGSKLYFSAIDSSVFFDFKLDFTKEKSVRGEDIFVSNLKGGIWEDVWPLAFLNTKEHKVVSQVFANCDLLITNNYQEKFGVKNDRNVGVQTTDLFFIRNIKSGYQIYHLPEPVNSNFTEADRWIADNQSFILFASYRPGHVDEFHKIEWKWNESFWGTTYFYVSLKENVYLSDPLDLGNKINTPFSERTPCFFNNGVILYSSSNGILPLLQPINMVLNQNRVELLEMVV